MFGSKLNCFSNFWALIFWFTVPINEKVWEPLFNGRDPNSSNIIELTTIATTGNAVDFGDLTQTIDELGAAAAGNRGFTLGGTPTPGINVIEFVEIVTTGNSQDFGDLTVGRFHCAGLSNGHGGL